MRYLGGLIIKKKSFNKKTAGDRTFKSRTFTVSCSSCGKQFILPIQPETKQNLVCVECLQKSKGK
ncbi:MAG: hypothetical protein ACOY4I_11265 [Bacillota bacterium]